MTTDYVQHTCKTCRTISLTQAANVQAQDGRRLLHCNTGHWHTYDADEIKIVQLETPQDMRAKMGLS